MTGRLEIQVEERAEGGGQVAVVRVAGEVDLSNSDQLAEALKEAVAGDSVARAVVDLSSVPFMDSSGLRVLLMAVQDGRPPLVVVIEPESPVARLIELAELTDRVPAFASEREALAAVPASGSDRNG